MLTDNEDFKSYSHEYQNNEKEILILTSDTSGAGSKYRNSWDACQYFLAYFDLDTNELLKGEGRVNWLITDEQNKNYGISWPYHLKKTTIYKLKVRELIDKTVPEGRLPSFYNRFMIVEILEEDYHDEKLLSILEKYKLPVEITDQKLGKFKLNKNHKSFKGEIEWINKKIAVSLHVDIESKKSWAQAMETLRLVSDQQESRDLEFRAYAAEKLTNLANDWLEDRNSKIITKNDFIQRIKLVELIVDSDKNFIAYYLDDDMFYGHAIVVYGNIQKGIKSASIEG